jgi:RNA polymerase sigma-70 factor (sigma-E family)
VRKGPDDDFISYVRGRLPALRRVAAQLAGDAHRGDDLVQQAITRLYTRWRRVAETENLDAYVYKILLRVFLDEQRLRWATVRLGTGPSDLDHLVGQSHPTSEVDDRMLLRDALALLPPKQRAVLVLRFLADRPVVEVAEILNVSGGTVKSQTHDGLTTLRRVLGADQRNGVNS